MNNSFRQRLILLLLLLCSSLAVLGQNTRVTGTVKDALTFEPIPFANVTFKGTTIGGTSDINGHFVIETTGNQDSVTASFVGYLPATLKVAPHKLNTLDIVLKVNKVDLPEVVIKPGENPALVLLRKIIENKPLNDRERLESYEYEGYNKVEFDISNISDKFKKQKVLKPFAFIFDYVDSTSTNKKPFLPIFMSETLSNFFYKKNPKSQKEIIVASKVSGIENPTVTQFMGDMYQNTNIYDNYINVFGKNFVSPLANVGTVYYRYYLVDSAFIEDKWCYKITYQPRRKQELTFTGDFWVNDSTFAIKKISARIADDANINFVTDLAVVQEFEQVEGKQWMLVKDILVVDFAAREEGMNAIGRKTASYRNFVINQPRTNDFFLQGGDIVVKEDATEKGGDFWATARHDSLSDREKKIYAMVDTIQSLPAFQTYVDIVTLFVSGYKVIGNFELGPYFTFFSFNQIEGPRFRIGGRTSNAFSTDLILSAYGAYGVKDGKFKYAVGAQYFLSKSPRQSVGLSYKHDVEQLGQSENAFQGDNILASVFRRTPANKLTFLEEAKAFYEYEWYPGFSSRVTFSHRFYDPIKPLDYTYYNNFPDTVGRKNTLNTTEIAFYSRFAYKEKFISGKVDRISIGTKYPILQLQYVLGLKGALGSDFTYHKAMVQLSHYFYVGAAGWTDYRFQAGKVWGTLPYPLLKVHEGNQSYSFDYLAYNLMNFFEFVSDEYASLSVTHHFDGLFLNRIPLMRRLKWREIASAQALVGQLNEANRSILQNKNTFTELTKPYAEAGVGLENIFKILRVDAIWRLSYIDKAYQDLYYTREKNNLMNLGRSDNPSKIATFGIRASLVLTF